MDPLKCFVEMLDLLVAGEDDEAERRAVDLTRWLQSGGFAPGVLKQELLSPSYRDRDRILLRIFCMGVIHWVNIVRNAPPPGFLSELKRGLDQKQLLCQKLQNELVNHVGRESSHVHSRIKALDDVQYLIKHLEQEYQPHADEADRGTSQQSTT